MRDYAKQRPYSIKIRSDSAPSFPDHSNNSLPSKLPPGLQLPSSIPNLPPFRLLGLRPPPFMGEPVHAERASPLFQDFAKYNRKTVAAPARLHVPSREPWIRHAALFFLVALPQDQESKIVLYPLDYSQLSPPNPNNRSN